MVDVKSVNVSLGCHFKLSEAHSDDRRWEGSHVEVSYASIVSSLMYAMVCTKSDIAQAVGVVSRYMSNPGKEHWRAVK